MSDETTTSEETTSEETTSEESTDTGLVIDDATPDTSIGGGELIPVSDAGAPKVVTTGQIKDYTIAQIVAATAASGVSLDNDKVYLLQGGALKPLTAADLGAAIMNAAFGRTAVAEINGNEVFAVKDSSDRKTITVSALASWLEANLDIIADIDIGSLGSADTLADTHIFAVEQSGTAKKATLSALKTLVLAGLYGYATSTTSAAANDDYLFIYTNNTLKKVKVSDSGIGKGDVTGPATTTADTVPRWDSTAKKLKDGLAIVDSVAASPTGTKLASEAAVAAVRTALQSAISELATAVSGKLSATKATEISTATTTDDSYVPSAKAVKTYSEGYVTSAVSTAITNALASGGSIANAISTAVSAAITTALSTGGSIANAISSAVATHGALEVGTTSGTTHPGEE